MIWIGAALVAAVIVTGMIWIARGKTDPPVAGPVMWSDTALTWAGDQGWYAAPVEATLPGTEFTLDVSARFTTDTGAAWGVWIETADGARVIYAISAEGYTTTRLCPEPGADIEACPALRPEWRWFAYPRLTRASNTITLHVEAPGQIRLRLNHETMGSAPLAWSGAWGVWVRGTSVAWEQAVVRWSQPG